MEYHSGGSLPLLGRPRYCPGANANGGYLCETGHCCGETGCCTYYYELWWFWLLWTVLILFSCCCAYRHRRAKLRVQQQQRQREISLLAYHGANSYPSSMLDLSFLASLKLPSYEEVAAQPSTPPPPYSSVFTTPRYPQPPRATDPHLLTQHDPLLHRPLSDGPSSLSSDNSSSCSCDSCCPSSPCSSSLSAPVTYETDTSHASTPSEATPLTLDVTMETIAAAATCLEVTETRFPSERVVPTVAVDIGDTDAAGAQEPVATDSLAPNQTVTVAVVTRAASPQSLSSPGSDVALPVGTTSPIKQQLDLAPCTPIVSICSLSTHPNPNVLDLTLPSIHIISTDGPDEGPKTSPTHKNTSGHSTPTASTSDSPTATKPLETFNLGRTFDKATIPKSPVSIPALDGGRTLTLITDSSSLTTCDLNPSLVPIPASSNLIQTPIKGTAQGLEPVSTNLIPLPGPVLTDITQTSQREVLGTVPTHLRQGPKPELEPAPTTLTLVPQPQSKTTHVQDFTLDPVLTQKPDLTIATDVAPTSSTLAQCQNPELSPGSAVVLVPASPRSSLIEHPGAIVGSSLDPVTVQANSGPSQVLSHLSELDLISPLPSDAKVSFSFGSGSAVAPVLNFPTPATSSSSSCPAINIESETSLAPSQSPLSALSPSSPPCHPSPPSLPSPSALSSSSLPAPALLLDPLTALHQSDKGGSSSGHASSLSPSPRATQSPPKQTLFSPCVDVFEPGPPNWDDGEEEQEEVNDDDEDEDMGADESQYRHRRLTGDSGIEVCRCRVKEEDEEEEEEEDGRKENGRKGGGGEKGNTDLHDSVDCPARGQITTGEGLTLCNSTSTTPTSDDSGKVVIVMETV
ncbi:mucin-5AC-like [Anabas testudineus]|uniref:Uncharacterized protein n=1 Tax=Anabas testudineus TaxID=64144 RepID=A0A3Q1I329_ANATE|nr:mucin-5AC-like [Anabas testudineus]XP_026225003.1 mucin-5AC-like [Anabas testudineus]